MSNGGSSGGRQPGGLSGKAWSFTNPLATSIRNPATPRSNQNRNISSNSVRTSGFSQFRSGCSGANKCKYQSPSGRRFQAEPPNADGQSVGGSSPFGPRPGRKT